MRHKSNSNQLRSIVWLLIIIILSGCAEYLNDPLKDKETGEELNLLIIDFNFFTTSMTYKLLDASDGTRITREAKISFTGPNGKDIVTFAGEKKSDFYTSEGQLELTIDPNVSVSENSPIEFGVNIEIEGYNALSQGIQIQSEGKKTYELFLSKIADENVVSGEIDFGAFANTNTTKSTIIAERPYTIYYTATGSDLLLFTDVAGNSLFSSVEEAEVIYNEYKETGKIFFALTTEVTIVDKLIIDAISVNGVNKSVLMQKYETGNITKVVIGGKEVRKLNDGRIKATCIYNEESAPENFGYAKFNTDSWELLGPVQYHESPTFEYTLVSTQMDLCEEEGTISFKSNVVSSFSIDVDIEDLKGNLITSKSFKGNFPEEFVFSKVPDMPVKLVFRNNNPAFELIPEMVVDNICNGDYEVEVKAKSEYDAYQIVLKAFCPDNPTIAVAPTYSAEFRKKNSDDDWQGVTMEGGVVDLLGLPNVEYELRLLWEDQWEYSSYSTKFDKDGNYLDTPEPGAKIKSEFLEDGRIRINIENIFSQSICDDLGW